MVYNSPSGIMVLDLATMKSKLLVPNPPRPAAADAAAGGQARGFGGRGFGGPRAIVAGYRTNSVFYTQTDPTTRTSAVYKADTNTGAITKLIELPGRLSISTINADETLAAGTYNAAEVPGDDPNAPNAFVTPAGGFGQGGGRGGARPPAAANSNAANPRLGGANVQSNDKGQMMIRRLAEHVPVVLFTIRLVPGPGGEKAGTIKPLLHTTDWIDHEQFSPTDPQLLLYAHEGMWQDVDRVWLIHTDGTGNMLVHKRSMRMEIAGHEFWGGHDDTLWYDWQYPKGEDFFLASYNVRTGERLAYHMQRNEWSIHFNVNRDQTLFCGDGGDSGQVAQAPDGEWIELFHPQMIAADALSKNEPSFFQPGVFHAEHLVNMAHQDYHAEPNPRFSPDSKYVFFTSNMFGRGYVFAVEVAKATDTHDAVSTPELATKYNPVMPTPTTTEK